MGFAFDRNSLCRAPSCKRTAMRQGYCATCYRRMLNTAGQNETRGPGHPLTDEEVEIIIKRVKKLEDPKKIAKDFRISLSTIQNIMSGSRKRPR